jgi:hypothetical protein
MPQQSGSAHESETSVAVPFRTLHKILAAIAAIFFVYLIVESTVLLPFMLMRFGWQ